MIDGLARRDFGARMNAKIILLLESDHDTRSALYELLAGEGYQIFEAANADQAQIILNKMPAVRVVIASLGVSEFECEGLVFEQIRSVRPEASIILVSSNPELFSVANEYQVAAIRKPFDVIQLFELIQAV
ncbi:MAG: response regulator [Proteobacteria bacterium]|nr:MAG: response regulator [Pseudomonadota bacterium]